MPNDITYQMVTPHWGKQLARFFQEIVRRNENRYFHPHPLDFEHAEEIASYRGRDLYFLQIKDSEITGYGMLRGWDEGFSVPSLGIAIHPEARRQGLGKEFISFMHQKAKDKGAKKIRLTVYANNAAALKLYHNFGYAFGEEKDHKVIGICEI